MSAFRRKHTFLLFTRLYLLSFAVLAGWFLLLLVGLLDPRVMAVANAVAVPTLLGSGFCLVVFKRLARGTEQRLS